MTPEELQTCFDGKERRKHCEYADAAADRAVKRTFAIFGIDVGDPEKVKKLQSVFQFAENMQKITKKSNIAFWLTFIAALAGGMALTFWEGLKSALKCLPFILLFALSAHAADVTLSLNPNSTTEPAGYRLYYGLTSHAYTSSADLGFRAKDVKFTVPLDLQQGEVYYFAATAYDAQANESSFLTR